MRPAATSDRDSDETDSQTGAPKASFRFRCIGCGSIADSAGQDFRCPQCANLLEITDPSWKSSCLSAAALKSQWRKRRDSSAPVDLSGVWRFRELLPAPHSEQAVVTLREGNTPLYELPQSSRRTGVKQILAKHQGMNPTGSFKDTGMTVAATFARQGEYRWVACASTGNTSASMAAYAARGGMLRPQIGTLRTNLAHLARRIARGAVHEIRRDGIGVRVPRLSDVVQENLHSAGISTVLALRHSRSRS